MSRFGFALPLLVLSLVPTPTFAAGGPPITYVALGDSTAVGVGAASGGGYPARLARRLEEAGVPVKLEMLAVSGATITDVEQAQLPRLMGAHANLVTLCIGINDVIRERPLREFARRLHVVADFVMRTKARVIMCELPDLSLSPSGKGAPAALLQRIEQYNAVIQTVAERHGFELADLFAASHAARGPASAELFSPDGFHPSGAGYERWAEVMWPAVERAVAPRLQARRAGTSGTGSGSPGAAR